MSASSSPTRSPEALQGQRQIDRRRRFADAALAARHRDDGMDAGNSRFGCRCLLAGGCVSRGLMTMGVRGGCRRGLAGRPLGGQHGGDRENAGQGGDGLLRLGAQPLELGRSRPVDLEGEGDMATAQRQARYHAEIDDIASAIGIGDGLEGGQHRGLACLDHA